MILTSEQKEKLFHYVPKAKAFIESDDLYELELAIDEQITDAGMDDDFELNELGHTLQRLYDQIHIANDL
jgi:hypothetical protein